MTPPRSVLPKALRRGGARPLRLVWPTHPRRIHRHLNKRQRTWLQRRAHELRLRLERQAKRRARLEREAATHQGTKRPVRSKGERVAG